MFDIMADRELTEHEKIGTMIQHYINGETGIIRYKTAGGYKVDWITSSAKLFLPWSKINEYVMIE